MKPGQVIKERLIPYRVLAYLLYLTPGSWVEKNQPGVVRVKTAVAARALRMKSSAFWETLRWLERQHLITSIKKENRKGQALVTLARPDRWEFPSE